MKTLTRIILLTVAILTVFLSGCPKKNDSPPAPSDIWDIDKDGIPTFVTKNYIDLTKIYRISKFRSSVGHDYSDAFEHCRSMKHYFEPSADIDWTTISIYSPVTGTITRIDQEWAGTKLEIASDQYPAFRFSIFHINLASPKNLNDKVQAGELLGHHIGSQTMSDISVLVNDPTKQGRMVSYFKVVDNDVFNEYSARGVISRDKMIISKEIRDANPLTCAGDQFNPGDTIGAWIDLDPIIR
jgi:hypothetical protein